MKTFITISIFSLLGLFAFGQTGQAPNEIFKLAFSEYQEQNYEAALRNFNIAVSLDPNRNYFYYNRGLTYKAMGNTGAAIADFRKSNELKLTAEAYYQIGIIYYDKNDFQNARTELENAKALRDDLDRMNFCLGMIYFRLNQIEEAYKCFADYTVSVKNYADAYYYRGLTEAKLGRYNEALSSFKLALRYKDNDWILYYKMYEFYMALDDKQNALNSITMVIEIGEKKVAYYEKRAELYKELGFDFKYDEDVAAIKKLNESPSASAGMNEVKKDL
jgi:tetratricopeptide (TPR) repeat protein